MNKLIYLYEHLYMVACRIKETSYLQILLIPMAYHVRIIPKSTRKILETDANSIDLTYLYMTAHSLGLIQTLQ